MSEASERGARKRIANLIPFNAMSKEQHLELSSRGGKKISEGKRVAAKLRELRKKGLSDSNSRRLYEIMTHADMSSLEIFRYIESLVMTADEPKEKSAIATLLINWHKLHHGDKIKTENVHHIIDWTDKLSKLEIKEEDGARPEETSE